MPRDGAGSAAGSATGLRFAVGGFAALSVFRPDCAIIAVGSLKPRSKNNIDRPHIFEKSCGFMRMPEEPAIESVEARSPILSARVQPEVDVCHVFYEFACDLVRREAQAKQK